MAVRQSREEGAILILALAYLVAVSLVVALLSTWATNDLNNTSHFSSANSLTVAATDATDVAIQYVRYTPLISSSQLLGWTPPTDEACWGSEPESSIPVINGDQIAVWCNTTWDPKNYVTRVVSFVACPTTVSEPECAANPTLTAVVNFDDYPPAPAASAPIEELCSVWCGSGMTIVSWEWGSSVGAAVTSVATHISFSIEPSDTYSMSTTNAAVLVTDVNGDPVAGDPVSLFEDTGPTGDISPLTVITNASGIAEFTGIVPQAPGNYILTASEGDENLQTNSSSFAVNAPRSVISPSTAPGNASAGDTYDPSATATSNDQVAITLDTGSSGCTMATVKTQLVVTFTGLGTCIIDFNDKGNASYSPALEVTQSIPVGGLAATQVAISLSPPMPPNPGASATTNVTITMTLENAVGKTVTLAKGATTTVVLSDIGSGFFSMSSGAAGTPTLSVTFTGGTATASTQTAYFGNENVGPDTISAINGTTNWGSASLTIQGGAATQVAITPNSTSPAVAALTNTILTFQLEDQFGNAVTSNGTTTLTLSDSGNGFFAAADGVTGAPTLNLTFAGGAGTATAYFGNETSGSDVITAKNGASAWGTSTVTPVAGAVASVQITLSPTNPAQSKYTNTAVTLQLVDQYGNDVATVACL